MKRTIQARSSFEGEILSGGDRSTKNANSKHISFTQATGQREIVEPLSPNPRISLNKGPTISDIEISNSKERDIVDIMNVDRVTRLRMQSNVKKIVYIEVERTKRLLVNVNLHEEEDLTVGWLFSEALRVVEKYFVHKKALDHDLLKRAKRISLVDQDNYDNRVMVALETINNNFTLDYWLTCYEKELKRLDDGITLRPVWHYPDVTRPRLGSQSSIEDFFVKGMIGGGGFSKVLLGI
jgi:hypothetical protein